MSTLSDIQTLYASVKDTWTKNPAHLIAHGVLGGVVFGICRATIPNLNIALIDPIQVSNNEWFKIAKDTGLIYLLLLVPLALIPGVLST